MGGRGSGGQHRGTHWTGAEDALLKRLYPMSDEDISLLIDGRSPHGVASRRRALGLVSGHRKLYPSKDLWISLATKAATEAGVSPAALMAGVVKQEITHARWRAWKAVHDLGYSLNGIGKVTGFHHTSILTALRKPESAQSPCAVASAAKPTLKPHAAEALIPHA